MVTAAVTTLAGCVSDIPTRGAQSVAPVATTSSLPPESSDQAPETFRVKACPPVGGGGGGGGKSVASILRDVRVGQVDDYDRVTFEFGPDSTTKVPLAKLVVPKYTVDSPASVSAGPSGEHVVVAGTTLLGVFFEGAYAHVDKGVRSYPGTPEIAPKGYPVLAEAKQGEDFEGHVRWALGLNKQRCPVVSTLTNPPRLVVDLPH